MQTALVDFIRDTPEGRDADAILRSCVHCGFCTATCPTYLLLGDELDGPRGRIYLIKEMLEGREVTAKTRLHLDRCLTCKSCETTCPSGVKYGRLVDIGRHVIDQRAPRPRGARRLLAGPRSVSRSPALCLALAFGRLWKPVLPLSLATRSSMRARRVCGRPRGIGGKCWRSTPACRARSRPVSMPRSLAFSTGSESRCCACPLPAAAARCPTI